MGGFAPKAAGQGAEGARKTFWCELACLGGETAAQGVSIEIEGERIASVETGAGAPPSGAIRLDGITIPGMANAHSHAFQRALRGRTQSGSGDFWTWREAMYGLAARLDPDLYLPLARATFAEMALAGITCVGEFHYLHHAARGAPYSNPNEMGEAILQAAREAGIRITLLDACYLHGGIGQELDDVQRRFSDGDAGSWVDRVEELASGDGARIGAAIHSVRAVDPDSAATVAEWAGERKLSLHAHLSEQPAENAACLEAYGSTPTAVLSGAGALSERFAAVHGTHLGDRDFALLGEAGSTCCLCPTTERDLADGIGEAARMRSAGIDLSLGSDSHAVIDLFEEARAVELDERLDSNERGRSPAAELLRTATASGHRCLGWPDAGRIEPGAMADLVTVRLDSPRLAGTDADNAVASVVFAASAADVSGVIAGGREIVRDGMHGELDVPAELDAAIRAVWT
jgi:formiminoglutamate deiminase